MADVNAQDLPQGSYDPDTHALTAFNKTTGAALQVSPVLSGGGAIVDATNFSEQVRGGVFGSLGGAPRLVAVDSVGAYAFADGGTSGGWARASGLAVGANKTNPAQLMGDFYVEGSSGGLIKKTEDYFIIGTGGNAAGSVYLEGNGYVAIDSTTLGDVTFASDFELSAKSSAAQEYTFEVNVYIPGYEQITFVHDLTHQVWTLRYKDSGGAQQELPLGVIVDVGYVSLGFIVASGNLTTTVNSTTRVLPMTDLQTLTQDRYPFVVSVSLYKAVGTTPIEVVMGNLDYLVKKA